MESPLARFLTRFPLDSDVVEDTTLIDAGREADEPADAEAARLAAALAEVEARAEHRIADLTKAHAEAMTQALADARALWCDTEALSLSQRIDAAFEALRAHLDEKIADAVIPLLADAVATRTRAALNQSLDLILADPDHPTLTLRGPGDLTDAIRRSRPNAAGIDYVAHDDLDAIVTAHGIRIETRLEAALAALAGHGS